MRKKLIISLTLMCFLTASIFCSVFFVNAADDENDFKITVNTEEQENGTEDAHHVNVNVYNNGPDFAGYIRLEIKGADLIYEKNITLAEKSEKDISFDIPYITLQMEYNVTFVVTVLNQSRDVLTEQEISLTIENTESSNNRNMSMGILSDSAYEIEKYFDTSDSIWIYGEETEVNLVEIEPYDLTNGTLRNLTWLLINDYDTSTLSKEEADAINIWVQDGGCLIIGTGRNEYLSLNGLESTTGFTQNTSSQNNAGVQNNISDQNDFGNLYDEAEFSTPSDAGNGEVNQGTGDGDADSDVHYSDYFYKDIAESTIDFASNIDYVEPLDSVYVKSFDDGSVSISIFDFADPDILNSDAQNRYIYISELCENAYNYTNYYMYDEVTCITDTEVKNMMAFFQETPELHSGELRTVLFIYILLIGPILYFVLKLLNKREKSLLIIPVIALIFVGVVFLIGRSSMINKTCLQSVTVAEASGEGVAKTYFTAFDSSSDDWEITLDETKNLTGLVSLDFSFDSYYYYSKGEVLVKDNGGEININYSPEESFETVALYAQGENQNQGEITVSEQDGIVYITNNTPYDFENYIVIAGGSAYYLSDSELESGSSAEVDCINDGTYLGNNETFDSALFNNTILNLFSRGSDDGETEYARSIAALYMGLLSVKPEYDTDKIYVFGSVKDYEKTAADGCDEIAWGSIYTVYER